MRMKKLFKKIKNTKEKTETVKLRTSLNIKDAPGRCASFLSGGCYFGKRLEDFLNYDNNKLEHNHHYIQHAFPLKEKSKYNITAPTLTDDEIHWIRSEDGNDARYNLKKMFIRMLEFYGFSYDNEMIKEAADFLRRSQIWLTPNNHNMKRISRILRSLAILGLEDESTAFYTALLAIAEKNPKIISKSVLAYWTSAVNAGKKKNEII